MTRRKNMNVLVIGQNGREHALAVSYAKSKKVKKVVMTPGNGLTDFNPSTSSGQGKIKNYPDVAMMDFDEIVKVCKKEKIDLVDVAQDDVVAAGLVDILEVEGIKAFGPTQAASEIEWNKIWSRNFMEKYKLPIPHFKSFSNQSSAIKYIEKLPEQLLYIKASGLAGGKGAIRAENKKQAKNAILAMSQFGKAGKNFVIEEGLIGKEFSLFVICDGEHFVVAKAARDYKTTYDSNKGPNTGGMGSVVPANVITASVIAIIETNILKPFLKGMRNEGRPYTGVLYLGGIITHSTSSGQANGIKIIEFNARWGDPEAEVILPSIQTDYMNVVSAVLEKKLKKLRIKFDKKVRISVAGCSKGYPGDYSLVLGKEIFGLLDAMKMPGIKVFGSGIKRKGNHFYANGGRIFHLVAEGNNIVEVRKKAYNAMKLITIEGNNLHFRTDIGL